MRRQYYVYMMANKPYGTIYIGVTNDIVRRVLQHKNAKSGSFTGRYELARLVYYEVFDWVQDAIEREKQLKSGSRRRKTDLIQAFNPTWRDLFDEIVD